LCRAGDGDDDGDTSKEVVVEDVDATPILIADTPLTNVSFLFYPFACVIWN